MLTPDDGRQDGQKIRYLKDPNTWRLYDPPLFDFLAQSLGDDGVRSVRRLEESSLLPRARYFSEILRDSEPNRGSYVTSALSTLASSDLLFFDPDNGLEVRTVPYGSKGSAQYLYWRDVEAAWGTGASLLIYQHFIHKPRTAFVSRLSLELQDRTRSGFIVAFRTANVVFLLAGQSRHKTQLNEAMSLVERRWRGKGNLAVMPRTNALTRAQQDAASEDLRRTQAAVGKLSAPSKKGVYAIYLCMPGLLAPFSESEAGLIYIGRSTNLGDREFEQHFSSEGTGFSTVRRSLGALLKRQLSLQAIPRAPGPSETNVRNYRFVDDGEARLTSWMCKHLEVGVHASARYEDIEDFLICQLKPLLNLTECSNPHRSEIKRLRKVCADEAREARRRSEP